MSTQTQNGIEAFRRRARTEDGRELGPYAFATERAAKAFADEATLALEYLGCEIS